MLAWAWEARAAGLSGLASQARAGPCGCRVVSGYVPYRYVWPQYRMYLLPLSG